MLPPAEFNLMLSLPLELDASEHAIPLRSLLDGLQEGFFTLDGNWRFGEMNRAAERHFSLSREVTRGKSIYEVLPNFAGSEAEARFAQALATGEPAIFDAPSSVHHGHTIKFNAFPLGSGLGISFRDVTRKRGADQALRESRSRLELATKAADLGIWDWNLQTGEMLYSERAKLIHGFELGHPVTLGMIRAATHPDDLPRTSAMAQRALDPSIREHVPFEYRVIRPYDGAVRWVLAYGEAIYAQINGAEQPVRYVGTLQDITDRHDAVEALRASQARLQLAIDAGHMAVWVYDLRTDSFQGSPELNRLYGFAPEAQPSLDEFRARYHPGDRARVVAAHQAAMESGERFFEVEFRCLWPDGTTRWLLMRAEIEGDALGRALRIVGVLLDFTERKRAEEHRELLINELNHRVKNTLATVQSVVWQTLRTATSLDEAQVGIENRLMALSRAHDVLTRESWSSASLHEIAVQAVGHHAGEDASRLTLRGPSIRVPPQMALAFAMGLQELATNAVKYGALSNVVGEVQISWRLDEAGSSRRLRLEWRERGGPRVRPPDRRGFGTRLIERSLAQELDGSVQITFGGKGITCVFDVPAPIEPRMF